MRKQLNWGASVVVSASMAVTAACSEAPTGPATAGASGQAGANSSAGAAGSPTQMTSGGFATGGSLGQAGVTSGGGGATGGEGSGGQAGTAGSASSAPNAPEPSSGCNAAAELPEGNGTLQVADLARKFVVRKPANYSAGGPWPLVLALHPNGSNTSYWDGTSGSRALGPLLGDKAVIIHAQARGADNKGDWRGDLPVDLAYFDALITDAKSKLCIDLKRIFAIGFSGGGSFSGVLGCHRQDIRAIAAGGAVIYFDEADCVGTPAAWITIGDGESVQGRLDYRDFFRTDAGCADTSKVGVPATCKAYDCPMPERPVTFCSHPGGHDWPDFGSKAAWDFFSQF